MTPTFPPSAYPGELGQSFAAHCAAANSSSSRHAVSKPDFNSGDALSAPPLIVTLWLNIDASECSISVPGRRVV